MPDCCVYNTSKPGKGACCLLTVSFSHTAKPKIKSSTMIGLIVGLLSWAFNLVLDLIPGKVRAALSDAVISVLQPMLMPVVYSNMMPDIVTRMAIRLQLQ